MAGGAVYLVYDQELLGPSDKSEAALRKAEEVVPPAMYQFSQYVCQQTGLEMPQVPWLGVGSLQVASGYPWGLLHPCLVEFCVSGFGRQGCNLSHVPAPVFLFLPSSQPLQRLSFRTSVIPGTQVGPYAPAWGGCLGIPASLPALFTSLILSSPLCLPVCVPVYHLWN